MPFRPNPAFRPASRLNSIVAAFCGVQQIFSGTCKEYAVPFFKKSATDPPRSITEQRVNADRLHGFLRLCETLLRTFFVT